MRFNVPIQNLSDIGTRGLVVFDPDGYSYSLEDSWRDFKIQDPSTELIALARSRAVVARTTQSSSAVFVNLSEMEFPRDDEPAAFEPGEATAEGGAEADATVILHEEGSFFAVTEQDLFTLEEGAEGDAGVLVNRGTIVAAIPRNDIPSGTWCVLVNLPSIVRRPERKLHAVDSVARTAEKP
jgi:hypothetical protein